MTTVFTPYIIPDASVLCSGLHLVKKMIKSEKFIIVVPLAGERSNQCHDKLTTKLVSVFNMITRCLMVASYIPRLSLSFSHFYMRENEERIGRAWVYICTRLVYFITTIKFIAN